MVVAGGCGESRGESPLHRCKVAVTEDEWVPELCCTTPCRRLAHGTENLHFVERVDLMLSVLSTTVAIAITVTRYSSGDSGARNVREPLEPTLGVITREEYLDGVTAAGRLGQHT